MKHILLTFNLMFLLGATLFAQPQVMNYQGVARDNAGMVIANQEISVRISILAENATGIPVFSETHKIKTSQFGVFSLKIGAGESVLYDISEVNWAGSDHYIQVEMDAAGGKNYQLMGASQLLSVPYAFHALTAGEIIGNSELNVKSGVPSQTWSLFGNSKTDPAKDRLGTTDNTDLVFITDNKERLRITADGKLITPGGVGLDLGGNLKVRGDTTTIDKDLYVGRNVYLNVSDDFTPRGETFNFGNFTVENMSSTLLTGGLQVNKNALFKEQVTLDNSGLGSTSTSTGGLVVAGGTGIGENLFVGGSTQLEGAVNITDVTSSASPVTGALTVAGGVGINENLNVGGAVDLENTLNVDGGTNLKSTFNVLGISTVNRLNANGQVTIKKSLATSEGSYGNYPLQVEGSQQGIAIKLTANNPGRSNNFVSFWGGDGSAKGRIEGMQGLTGISRDFVSNIIGNNPGFGDVIDNSQSRNQGAPSVSANQYFNNDYAFGAYSLTLDFVNSIIKFAVNAIGASGACLSGDCDDVVWSAVDLVVNGIQLGGYIAYNEVNRGVAFESGGADYAEWLMKSDTTEVFTFGDVVGISGGLISKNYRKAENYMIISKDPTVIGAMPDEADKNKYEKIAFMGQVPVKVIGKVKKGDYILPSGNSDGMAIAVAPNKMAAMDYSRIIGISWGESDGKKVFDYINTAVGINSNDMAGVIENMQSLLNDMQMALASVAPDFEPQLYAVAGGSSGRYSNQITTSQTLQDIIGNQSDALEYNSMEEALSKAEEYAQIQNVDLSQYPYLEEMFENPSDELAEEILAHYTNVLNRLTAAMAEYQQN